MGTPPLVPRDSQKSNGDKCLELGAKPRARNSVNTSSTSLDSRTATEPAISSRLCCPHLVIPRSPLYDPLEPPRIVCSSGVLQTAVCSVGVQRRLERETGGGNRPEPDARLQVREALTRGSSVKEPWVLSISVRGTLEAVEARRNCGCPYALTRAQRERQQGEGTKG